jgi:hypothetical protein
MKSIRLKYSNSQHVIKLPFGKSVLRIYVPMPALVLDLSEPINPLDPSGYSMYHYLEEIQSLKV